MSRTRSVLRLLLALSVPMLILLALLSLASRHGSQRFQAVPALVIGSALLVSSGVRRARRRRILLGALRTVEPPAGDGRPPVMGG